MTRILVVDDDADIRATIRDILIAEGYDVDEAAEGDEAIRRFELAASAELVLLDLYMPGKEGFETLREMLERWPEARIVAVSGGGRFADTSILSVATALGAVSSLAKPFSLEQLKETVRSALGM